MNMTRRTFLGGCASLGAVGALNGCRFAGASGEDPRIAVQLYSIKKYIKGIKDKNGSVVVPGVGLERALEDVARIGYKGVEFAGYYGFSARDIRRMLDNAGLVACGSHVGNWHAIEGDNLKHLAEFNQEIGSSVMICPHGTGPDDHDWRDPTWTESCERHMPFITDFFNQATEKAKAYGCRVGIHNHDWEFLLKDRNGVSFWDRFLSRTTDDVLMEQDVGWTTCAGRDPCTEFGKYPNRSPTLHAKENGMGKNVTRFDGILGQPGLPDARPVDWQSLRTVATENGTKWWVVECEAHFEDLSAITPSYKFLTSKIFV